MYIHFIICLFKKKISNGQLKNEFMEFFKFIFIYITYYINNWLWINFFKKFTRYNNFNRENISIGYVGLFGIFFSIIISYSSNLFFPHNNLHNFIFILLGIIFFLSFHNELKKKLISKYFLFSYIISIFAIFYFKSHDDFSYYHL